MGNTRQYRYTEYKLTHYAPQFPLFETLQALDATGDRQSTRQPRLLGPGRLSEPTVEPNRLLLYIRITTTPCQLVRAYEGR